MDGGAPEYLRANTSAPAAGPTGPTGAAYSTGTPLHHSTNGSALAGLPGSAPGSTSSSLANNLPTTSALDLTIDFTRPDGQRTRPLLIDGKRLYVDEHYISVWSPVLRSWCIECPDRELILANVQYEHVLELLLAIHPTYKEIDDQTVHVLLPLAFDYQMDGLLHRSECFLISNKLPFLEKVWLADRYQLNRLLSLLLRELKPNHKLDLSGSRYYGLSDRVKVLLLERMHGSQPPEELAEPPVDMEHFFNATDLNFAAIRAKTGRSYYVNPYYVAAWSSVFQDLLCSMSVNLTDDIVCPCTHEELKFFLMAIYPPQLRITETNIGPTLMAACKMESHGLLRKCAQILLMPQTQLSVFVRLSLLDRCKLQELLDQCLTMVHKPDHLIEMTQQQTYDCLTVRARAALLDRFRVLIQQSGGGGFKHLCLRCKASSSCTEVTWMCPQCKSYSSEVKPSTIQSNPQQPNIQYTQTALNHHGTHQTTSSPHHQTQKQSAINPASGYQNNHVRTSSTHR
ncbi:BTB/POZ domain-containing protein [Ditylenchus destructor]|nr:BTB/POZ domain-containing protein [Ditylenchus destructor]